MCAIKDHSNYAKDIQSNLLTSTVTEICIGECMSGMRMCRVSPCHQLKECQAAAHEK